MVSNSFDPRFGSLVMYGWIGTDPRNGSEIPFLCLATPGDGARDLAVEEAMSLVAKVFGMNPQRGAITDQPDAGLHLELRGDGWLTLVGPGGLVIGHPGSREMRELMRERGEAVLVLSYVPMPAGMDHALHADATGEGGCVLTLVPVR